MNQLLFSISILLFLSSCLQNKKETSVEICAQKFDSLFMELFNNDTVYQIERLELASPNFAPNFYSKKELSKYLFLKLSNENTVFNVGIDTLSPYSSHALYFCLEFFNFQYIDLSVNALGNYNFLNDCNISIPRTENNQLGWTQNIYNKLYDGVWKVDSVHGSTNVSHIKFSQHNYILNSLDTIQFYKNSFEIYNKPDSVLAFESIAISESKLILNDVINNDTLFLTK